MAVITSLVSDQGSGHAGGEEAGHGTGDVRPEGQPGEVPAAFLGQRAEGCNLEKAASFVLKAFLGIAQRLCWGLLPWARITALPKCFERYFLVKECSAALVQYQI